MNNDFIGAMTLYKYSFLSKEEFIDTVEPFLTKNKANTINHLQDFVDKEVSSSNNTNADSIKEDEIWKQVLELIGTTISNPSFDTWLKNTTCSLENNLATVYCGNEFQRDWLKERYTPHDGVFKRSFTRCSRIYCYN
ncbi:DnaA N-terminal domain-containing protein [Niallia sp.]|uniref:DnaA N-terminal domain-containing protein n=1 Tax=Niallia sp. TaxID=2837523 RepID=UPI00289786B7|nr:DnaA N-terminal domain-containing protein [Niallia sp.]